MAKAKPGKSARDELTARHREKRAELAKLRAELDGIEKQLAAAPPAPQVRTTARSRHNLGLIEDRLKVLEGDKSPEAVAEVEYLHDLKARKYPGG
jgi:hypothetical protein